MTEEPKKKTPQDKVKNPKQTDLEKKAGPTPGKAEGEREDEVSEDEVSED